MWNLKSLFNSSTEDLLQKQIVLLEDVIELLEARLAKEEASVKREQEIQEIRVKALEERVADLKQSVLSLENRNTVLIDRLLAKSGVQPITQMPILPPKPNPVTSTLPRVAAIQRLKAEASKGKAIVNRDALEEELRNLPTDDEIENVVSKLAAQVQEG